VLFLSKSAFSLKMLVITGKKTYNVAVHEKEKEMVR